MNLYKSDGKADVGSKNVLMIPNTQAQLRNKVEVMSWLGLAWLLLGRAH